MRKVVNSVRILGLSAIVSLSIVSNALAEKIIIGHFGNPTPMQVAAAENKFSEATGWDIEWRKFSSGTDVIAAIASGDIKVAELGSSPLAIAASQGVDLELVMMAQVIGEAESLIVSNASGINELADLKGKRIAVPVGSTAHFSIMGAISHTGLTTKDVQIINMAPDAIAAAWQQNAIDAAFIWQPVQSKIVQSGKLLVGADKTAEWGFPTFDGWVVNKEFGQENSESVSKFLKVMDEANAAYLQDPSAWTASSAEVKTIADRTGADVSQIPTILEGFTFLPLSEQVKPQWLGGSTVKAVKSTADFLKEANKIDTVRDDYTPFVNSDFAKNAN